MWYKYNTTITTVVLFTMVIVKVIVVERVFSLAKTIVVDVFVIYIPRIPLWYFLLWEAFDCLDHAILLSKLKYYGLNDNAIKLLKIIYLIETNNYVQLGNFKSQYHNISCGIPQGSVILSLMIFLRPPRTLTLLCMLMTPLWCPCLKFWTYL